MSEGQKLVQGCCSMNDEEEGKAKPLRVQVIWVLVGVASNPHFVMSRSHRENLFPCYCEGGSIKEEVGNLEVPLWFG